MNGWMNRVLIMSDDNVLRATLFPVFRDRGLEVWQSRDAESAAVLLKEKDIPYIVVRSIDPEDMQFDDVLYLMQHFPYKKIIPLLNSEGNYSEEYLGLVGLF